MIQKTPGKEVLYTALWFVPSIIILIIVFYSIPDSWRRLHPGLEKPIFLGGKPAEAKQRVRLLGMRGTKKIVANDDAEVLFAGSSIASYAGYHWPDIPYIWANGNDKDSELCKTIIHNLYKFPKCKYVVLLTGRRSFGTILRGYQSGRWNKEQKEAKKEQLVKKIFSTKEEIYKVRPDITTIVVDPEFLARTALAHPNGGKDKIHPDGPGYDLVRQEINRQAGFELVPERELRTVNNVENPEPTRVTKKLIAWLQI